MSLIDELSFAGHQHVMLNGRRDVVSEFENTGILVEKFVDHGIDPVLGRPTQPATQFYQEVRAASGESSSAGHDTIEWLVGPTAKL